MKLNIFILLISILLHSSVYSIENEPIELLKEIIKECRPMLHGSNDILLEEKLTKYIDFNEMALWISGKKIWNDASCTQKINFINELKKLILKTYKKTVYYYIDANIDFSKHSINSSSKRIQISSTMKKNNKNIIVNYRLIKHDNSWLVFDIIIEGISILKSLKTQFSDLIKTEGLDSITLKIKKINKV